MQLLRRHKSILLALGIYWPVIFWLTHIPVPVIARQSGMSDKTMHVLAYFVLTFLVWFAVSPYEKVRWNKWKCWVVLTAVIVYAALDEVLQSCVARSADMLDFRADLFGAGLGLGILSVLSFWPAMLTAAAGFIFVISNMSNLLKLYPHYHLNTVFHFTAYTAFALLWMQLLERHSPLRAPGVSWLLYSLLVPAAALLSVKAAAPLFSRPISMTDIATALSGIVLAVLVSAAVLRCSRKSNRTPEGF